jgi:hypothetical protein
MKKIGIFTQLKVSLLVSPNINDLPGTSICQSGGPLEIPGAVPSQKSKLRAQAAITGTNKPARQPRGNEATLSRSDGVSSQTSFHHLTFACPVAWDRVLFFRTAGRGALSGAGNAAREGGQGSVLRKAVVRTMSKPVKLKKYSENQEYFS